MPGGEVKKHSTKRVGEYEIVDDRVYFYDPKMAVNVKRFGVVWFREITFHYNYSMPVDPYNDHTLDLIIEEEKMIKKYMEDNKIGNIKDAILKLKREGKLKILTESTKLYNAKQVHMGFKTKLDQAWVMSDDDIAFVKILAIITLFAVIGIGLIIIFKNPAPVSCLSYNDTITAVRVGIHGTSNGVVV